LPWDFPSRGIDFDVREHSINLSREMTGRLEAFARSARVTMSTLIQSAWSVLLGRSSGSDDVVFGSIISGRPADLKGAEDMIGLFINSLPVRADLSLSVNEMLRSVQEKSLMIQEYGYSFLPDVKACSGIHHESNLFDSLVIFENYPLDSFEMEPGDGTGISDIRALEMTNFDLTLCVIPGENLKMTLAYKESRFRNSTAILLLERLVTILERMMTHGPVACSEIDIMDDVEKQKVIHAFNETGMEYPEESTIVDLFESQVKKRGKASAISFMDESVSFEELNSRANGLAHSLRSRGVKRGMVVPIILDSPVETVTAILGILKSGAAYLPIDSEYPGARIKFILGDSGARVVITSDKFMDTLPLSFDVICLGRDSGELEECSDHNPERINEPGDTAYVIYTSGSTGRPKGTLVPHRGVVNLIHSLKEEIYSLYDGSLRVAQLASFSFDASVQQIFASLLLGNTLYPIPAHMKRDMTILIPYISENGIEVIDGTPSLWEMLVENGISKNENCLKHIIVGGEPLPVRLIERFAEGKNSGAVRWSNVYGVTESSVDSTIFHANAESIRDFIHVPIGVPMANTQIYILDRERRPVPPGVQGEIFIGGHGLASRYLNNEPLTEKSFIRNPFIKNARIYKTGDLGRWLPDGNIEFIGRIDCQVKIRGFRIEMGEIEIAMTGHEEINDCVIMDRMDANGEKFLIAYYVSGPELTVSDIRDFLGLSLPDYMIPQKFIWLKELPLNTSGKVDRSALPEPDDIRPELLVVFVAPRNETEERIAAIWRQILGIEEVGVKDNFFELGGHSLRATQVMSMIKREFMVDIPLKAVFEGPTVEHLARLITENEGRVFSSIEPLEKREFYELSNAQQRLWFLDKLIPDSSSYNIHGDILLEGDIDIDAMTRAMDAVAARHESLRTLFATVEDEPVQVILEDSPFHIPMDDLSDDGNLEERLEKIIEDEASAIFDLEKGPLFRVRIVKLEDKKHMLLMTMHHIISDAWSSEIILKEAAYAYASIVQTGTVELPELKVQYRDFAAWQRSLLEKGSLSEQEDYWKNELKGPLPVLDIPSDRSRPPVQRDNGDVYNFTLEKDLSDRLARIASDNDATIFMIFLASFSLFLNKMSHQDDIIIGSPISGRNHPDLDGIIGFFVNTLALRIDLGDNPDFIDLLKQVREKSINAFANQDYPFDRLIDVINPVRDTSRSPIFNVMFVHQNLTEIMEKTTLENITFSDMTRDRGIAKFDLTLFAIERAHGMDLSFEYNTDLFNKSTMERYARYFKNLLRAIAAMPQKSLSGLELLDDSDKRVLVEEFNNTVTAFPEERCIHELIGDRIEKDRDRIALVFRDEKLTYGEMSKRVNRLANYLRERGVGPEVPVGIFMDRSIEMVVGVLAVIEAGGAYVPIESEYPRARIEYMLNDCGAKQLLTLSPMLERLPDYDGEIIFLDSDWERVELMPHTRPVMKNSSSDLVYIIYTSGSTGNPKGIEIEHRGLVNYITWAVDFYEAEGMGAFPLYTSMSFDLTVTSIFVPLTAGESVEIMPSDLDATELVEQVITSGADIAKLTPAHLEIADMLTTVGVVKPEKLNRMILGGEALSAKVSRSMQEKYPGLVIYNEYGPAETVVGCIVYKFDSLDPDCTNVSIGKPINNTVIYILDKNRNLVPQGVPGEIYISSPGVARGYLNRDDITERSFVRNPFNHDETIYRTGDLARWTSDGSIDYLGRVDHQVKIRGYRIEPGEIESVMTSIDGIRESVVVDRSDSQGDIYLAGYYVTDKEVSASDLKESMRVRLPEYMIPSRFMKLNEIPLNPNGKVERRALPEPDSLLSGAEYAAPGSDTEIELARLWQEVLGIERAGVFDNFFDLGGHSLKVTRIIAKIRKNFGVNIQVRDFFTDPTINGLSKIIDGGSVTGFGPIEPMETRDYYELSHAQKRLWFLDQMTPGTATYNIPMILNLDSSLDVDRLEKAINIVTRRDESLRTCFMDNSGKPVQVVVPELEVKIDLIGSSDDDAMKHAITEMLKPFDLSQAPLFRLKVIKKNNGSCILVLTMHHIISDGWSMEIMVRSIMSAYGSPADGIDSGPAPLTVQYRDFAAWQNGLISGDGMKDQEQYWLDKLGGMLPVLDIPSDKPRPQMQTQNGAAYTFTVDGERTERLKTMARENNVTMFMLLMAFFDIMLMKLSGLEDIILGTPIAGRNHPDVQDLIGFFVNTLAMRVDLSGDPEFSEMIARVRETSIGAYANQDYPFDQLIDVLNPVRDISRSPIFDIFFVFHQNDGDVAGAARSGGIGFDGMIEGISSSKFDLTLNISDLGDRLDAVFEYNTDLFNRDTVERFSGYFINLIDAVTDDPSKRISQYEMTGADERKRLLLGFNSTDAFYPENRCPYQLFEEQAAITPEKIALEFDGNEMTYRELNEKTNQLAHYLIKAGVEKESKVGLLVDRSFEMLIGILAIQKAGGAYVPMDPEYPGTRIEYMIEDSGSPVLVSQSHHIRDLEKRPERAIALDSDWHEIALESTENLQAQSGPHNLSHLIYTSGSTGLPKGVMIEHRNVTAFLYWALDEFTYDEYELMIAATSMCFDLSVFEFFLPLITGAKVIILRSSLDMAEYLETNRATMINTVPSALRHFLTVATKRHRVKAINLAGEPLKLDLVRDAYSGVDVDKVRNLYGPTEDTTYSTGFMVPEDFDRQPLIGKPIGNTRAYILDKNLKPVPMGVKGEIYLTGANLARGYWNAPEKTAERFIPNPYSSELCPFIYKTGDLGSWLPDGNIDFHGRVDYQVKIRGNRIELGEIEARLALLDEISDVVVVDRDDSQGNKFLVCYYQSHIDLNTGTLREHITESLPEYMVPSRFIRMDKLPLTPNGKVDRKSLPEPDDLRPVVETEYVAPGNETEKILASVWQEILGIEQIGIRDNFFDMGGHSLKVTEVVAIVKKRFNVNIRVRAIFEEPTIEGLALIISGAVSDGYSAIEPLEKREFYELSHAQKRLWFLDQMMPGQATYNIPMAMILDRGVDVDVLRDALQIIVERDESLRTCFSSKNGEPVQVIADELRVRVEVKTISESEAVACAIEEITTPFDLSEAPLFRVKLFEMSDGRFLFVFTMHHIISDGWSLKVLVRDLLKSYASLLTGQDVKLPELTVQYRDYAAWQNDLMNSGGLKDQEDYWREKLGSTLPVLDLPFDRPRPPVQTMNGSGLKITFNPVIKDRIYGMTKEKGVTLYMFMLAAFKVLLLKLSSQEDVIVGSPIAGRNHPDIENIIGFFVNTIALRTDLGGDPLFDELLGRVREVCLDGYGNQDYPFDSIIDILNPVRDTGRSPIFSTFFVLQNEADSLSFSNLEGMNMEEIAGDSTSAKYDLSLYISEFSDRLEAYFEYNTDLFDHATIERFAEYYISLVEAITDDPGKKLSDYNVLSVEEREMLLVDFNDTAVDYERDLCTYQIFEKRALEAPDSIALICGEEKLTYGELNERANQLARLLRSKGTGRDDIVGLMVERSVEMIVGLLGVLKAGGAYLPLDPVYPEERIKYMLEDSRAPVLLSQRKLEEKIQRMNFKGDVIDIFDESIYSGDGSNLDCVNDPGDLIYVIYTSGSTGKPKGVMLEHGNVVNFIRGMTDEIDFSPGKTIVCLTTISFDIFVLETHLALAKGLRIVMADEYEQNDPELLKDLIVSNNVDMLQATPSRLRLLMGSGNFMESMKGLSELLVGGEPFPENLFDTLKGNYSGKIYNVYGPTETTVWSTMQDMTESDSIDIGKPIANTRIYIVDSNNNLQPRGMSGELCIGGDGLARGYMNRQELTDEKFVPDPFMPGKKMYRTGDLASWLPDGNLVCHGRVDFQVKIRGNRIELGEIEAKLGLNELVDDVTVIDRDDKQGNKFLVAYYVSKEEMTPAVFRSFLKEELPDYMIPSRFIRMEKLPLTPNGKVDRKSLPEPGDLEPVSRTEYEAPENDIERALAELWQEVLGIERVGRGDNFFDLGGHSLLIMKIIAKLQLSYPISVQDFFDYQTVKQLAARIEENVNDALASTAPEDLKEEVMEDIEVDINISGNRDNPETILITGVTGYLGAHLLYELLEKTDARIYCLIRGEGREQVDERLISTMAFYFGDREVDISRVTAIRGDIALDGLGLSEDDFGELCSGIDTIIHSAADVRHYGEYFHFENVNVRGTERMLDLAQIAGCRRFHYISTMSVAGDHVPGMSRIVFRESDYNRGQRLDNVYSRSKFAAEGLVREAMEEGLDATIYRVGILVGEKETGKFQQAIGSNAFYGFLKGIIHSGAILDIADAMVEMTPIDSCRNAVSELILMPETSGLCLHIYNPNYTSFSSLAAYLKSYGFDIDLMSGVDFINAMKDMQGSDKGMDTLESLVPHLTGGKSRTTRVVHDNSVTAYLLDSVGFHWPAIDSELVHKLIRYCVEVDFIDPPASEKEIVSIGDEK